DAGPHAGDAGAADALFARHRDEHAVRLEALGDALVRGDAEHAPVVDLDLEPVVARSIHRQRAEGLTVEAVGAEPRRLAGPARGLDEAGRAAGVDMAAGLGAGHERVEAMARTVGPVDVDAHLARPGRGG